MTTANTKYSTSLAKLFAVVRELQEKNVTRQELLVSLDELLGNQQLFTKGQRANVVKALNVEFGLTLTIGEIKAAARITPPAAAVHVDGLSGTATVDAVKKGPDSEPVAMEMSQREGEPGTYTYALSEHRHQDSAPAGTITKAPTDETTSTEENTMTRKMPHDIVLENRARSEEAAAAQPAPVNATPEAAAPAPAATPSITDISNEIIGAFLVAHPHHLPTWNSQREAAPAYGVTDLFKKWLAADDVLSGEFALFLQSYTPAQPKTLGGTLMTSLRGERDAGLRSGVVAAAAAVIGGGLEMAFKGSVNFGSGLGTAAGAVGAYFAAEAADGMMESETGRYIVAGSIGVIAGGLGSRLGRVAQDRFTGGVSEAGVTGIEAPAPTLGSSPMVSNSEAMAAMLGM